MIKKMTLVFETTLQEEWEKLGIANLPGIFKAMRLLTELVVVALQGGFDAAKAKKVGGCGWKLFRHGHSENALLKETVRQSCRVETSIDHWVFREIQVRFVFYREASARWFSTVIFTVNLDTATVIGCSGVIIPDPADFANHKSPRGTRGRRRINVK